jgi:hypothetical protein
MPLLLELFKVLLDFLLIGVQIGAIYFPTKYGLFAFAPGMASV